MATERDRVQGDTVIGNELEGLVRDIEAFRAEVNQLGQCPCPDVDMDPSNKPQGNVTEAHSSFMFKHWHDVLTRTIDGTTTEEGPTKPIETQEQLAALYNAADAEVQHVLSTIIAASAERDKAYETLVQRRDEVDKVLHLLETEYQRLQNQAEGGGGDLDGVSGESDDRMPLNGVEDGQEPSLQALIEEDECLQRQYEELLAAKANSEVELEQHKRQLEELQAQVREAEQLLEAQEPGTPSGGDLDEEGLKAETTKLEERAEWCTAVLKAMEVLQGVRAETCEGHSDSSSTGDAESTFILRLTYLSTEHTLYLTLTQSSPIRIVDASLRAASHRKRIDVTLQDIMDLASALSPPDDLMFVAREVGWRLDSMAHIQAEVISLQQRYVLKHNEGRDLTVTFPQGVVGTIKLLPGYPQLPGSLRFTSLVGVGGWRDAELGTLCRTMNLEAPQTLTEAIDKLHEKLVELDSTPS